jgi:hypothetical protein
MKNVRSSLKKKNIMKIKKKKPEDKGLLHEMKKQLLLVRFRLLHLGKLWGEGYFGVHSVSEMQIYTP